MAKRTIRWVLVRVAGVAKGLEVATLIRDKTVGELEALKPSPYAIEYTQLDGSPLTKGGMGAYQWCHDCRTWGIPGPFVESVLQGRSHLNCGGCGSENVAIYGLLFDQRNGEIVRGDDEFDLRSYDSVAGCSVCRKKESDDRLTCFQPIPALDYYLCAECLRRAADSCDRMDMGLERHEAALGLLGGPPLPRVRIPSAQRKAMYLLGEAPVHISDSDEIDSQLSRGLVQATQQLEQNAPKAYPKGCLPGQFWVSITRDIEGESEGWPGLEAEA